MAMPMPRCVLLALVALLMAACSAPLAHHTSGADANVEMCKKIEAYPKVTTVLAERKYIAFLHHLLPAPGVSARLSITVKGIAYELTMILKTEGATSGPVTLNAKGLNAVCASYGVRS
jgi:hypothetical protein